MRRRTASALAAVASTLLVVRGARSSTPDDAPAAALHAPAARAATAPAAALHAPAARAATGPSCPASGGVTTVEMRHVDFRVAAGVVLHIDHLLGEMHGTRGGVVDFDDPTSYVTTVRAAEVSLRGADLTALMNGHVFAYRGAPLSHLTVALRGGLVEQRGTLHKGVDIPFSIAAVPSLTADGRIRLHPTRIRIFGVNGAVLLRALGLDLQKMVDLSKATGVSVEGNDLLLDATAILPPPAIRGRITAVRVEGDALVQRFGSDADSAAAARDAPATPDSSSRNFMLYRGGTLHFGKLLMADAEMLVVDADERDAFDFDNPHYQRQLIAGASRTLPDLGLEVRMPDAHALPQDGRR